MHSEVQSYHRSMQFLLIEIFKEGDKRKIDAVMAQLSALDPHPKIGDVVKSFRGRPRIKKKAT